MNEVEYRKQVGEVFKKIEASFEEVDPDLAELECAYGALTVFFSNKSRCILSTQPSVRQIWLAAASKGVAYHFNYDADKCVWVDDKSQGIELLSYLKQLVFETCQLELKI